MPRRFSHSIFGPSSLQRFCKSLLVFSILSFALGYTAVAQETSGPNVPLAADTDSSALPDAPQSQAAGQPPAKKSDDVTLANTPAHFLKDQVGIWTSPARIREHDLTYLVPIGLATTLAITVDHQTMSSSKLNDASLNSHAATASNGLLGGFVAAPVIIYGLGHIHHNEHATESGILAGEAMVDSLVVDEVMKAVSMRERPALDGARGKFFQSSVGLDSSFPSTHSMIAWSSAAVIASEYDGPLTKLTAYGLATGVSLSRVLARQHFPSDVVVGSAVGWLVGRYVFHKHRKQDADY
jgi:membrane-associated phospholipid phosphatase